MKTLLLTLSLLFAVSMHSVASTGRDKDKPKTEKKESLKDQLDRQVKRHLFFPMAKALDLEGTADVLLQVYPEGDVQVVLINSKNPLVKKFVERQVRKMKVDKDKVVVGEIFKYRLSFLKQ